MTHNNKPEADDLSSNNSLGNEDPDSRTDFNCKKKQHKETAIAAQEQSTKTTIRCERSKLRTFTTLRIIKNS